MIIGLMINFITECDGKIQTELFKTVGPSNSHRNTAKSFEANTVQLDKLHL